MKAAIWHGVKDIRVEEVDLGELKENEVKVKVAWAGICGSDLHEYLHGPIFINTEQPDPFTGDIAPVIMGHEFAGVVEETGSNVTSVKVGDRIAINPTITHGNKHESVDRYDGMSFIGLNGNGGFTKYAIVPEDNAYLLGEHLSLQDGALVEPMAVTVQAVLDAGVKLGDTVAIFGAGPIGLLTILAAKAAGASEIFVTDIAEFRLEKAKELGATHIINSGNADPVKEIRNLCPDGVDVAFEVAGVAPTFKQAIDVTKAQGVVDVVSIFAREIQWSPMQITNTGVTIKASIVYSPSTFRKTINAMNSGQLEPHKIVTSLTELDNIVENGFEALTNDKTQAKILVKLSGEK
ncbi:2,3-butanediol dehydrogenase [Alkalihalobacillus sp. 1P02AB]|uniref:2,3-butanediol dehydrogenase n=1 Tax=Alkalihalobacillus sp. 1P02AB TaxID=3132260 RepID=UPI0039A5172F